MTQRLGLVVCWGLAQRCCVGLRERETDTHTHTQDGPILPQTDRQAGRRGRPLQPQAVPWKERRRNWLALQRRRETSSSSSFSHRQPRPVPGPVKTAARPTSGPPDPAGAATPSRGIDTVTRPDERVEQGTRGGPGFVAAGRWPFGPTPTLYPSSERQKRQESFSAFSQADLVFRIQPRQVVGLRYLSPLAGCRQTAIPSQKKNKGSARHDSEPIAVYCGAASAVSVVLRRALQGRIWSE